MLENALEMLKDLFYWMINTVIEVMASLIEVASSFMPEFSLPLPNPDFAGFNVISGLNWVFPVSTALHCVEAFVLSVTLYFTLGIILRWAKVTN